MTDPKRLTDQTDLPPQLHAALRALGQTTTPPEVVERMQRSLAGMPSVSAAGGFPFGWGGALSTVAVAVAVAATVTWMRVQREDARAVPASVAVARTEQVESVESESTPEPSPAASRVETDPHEVSAAVVASGPSVPEPQPSASVHAPTQRQVMPQVRAGRESAATPVAAASTLRSAVPVERNAKVATVVTAEQRSEPSASSAGSALAEAAKPVTAEPLTPAATKPVEEVAEAAVSEPASRTELRQAPAPEDEASLVYRAKRLARTNRAAAWSLIESHAQHFPNGALVEEREVLAIDVLRGMGRHREAKERATRFIAHFPRSGYRSVVAKFAASPR